MNLARRWATAVIAFGAPESSAKPAEAITECGFGGLEGLGGEPQSHGGGRWSME